MTVWLSVDISSVVTYFNGIFHYKKKTAMSYNQIKTS